MSAKRPLRRTLRDLDLIRIRTTVSLLLWRAGTGLKSYPSNQEYSISNALQPSSPFNLLPAAFRKYPRLIKYYTTIQFTIQFPAQIKMKYSVASILLIASAWTAQAMPTAVPSMGGRARGVSIRISQYLPSYILTRHIQLPYNAVRSIHSQRRRQETTAAAGTAVPDVTSVLDLPTSDPMLSSTTVAVVTSEPTAITSDADIPTSEPLPPTTTDAITSDPTEITSVPDAPTTEPLPPTTADVITSEPVTVLPTQVATPVDSPTAEPSTLVETFFARSPYTNTTTPPTTIA